MHNTDRTPTIPATEIIARITGEYVPAGMFYTGTHRAN